MKRGTLVTARFSRELGKTRPALVVQSDRFAIVETILLCPLTSELSDTTPVRVPIDPSKANGLSVPSRIMIDKIFAVGRDRIGDMIGVVEPEVLAMVDQRLLFVLGLAD